jgi:hypothetical protein
MTRLAQEFFIAVFIASAHPERSLMVDSYAHANPAITLTLLAESAVAGTDPIPVLYASPTTLTLDCVGPGRIEGGEAITGCRETRLQGL